MKRRETPFKDHFSKASEGYAAHRPTYPLALVDFLAEVTPRHSLAWDAGSGSGQLSVLLATFFERVVATDSSEQQIVRAIAHPRVDYYCAHAEASSLPDGVVDLAVAAQAAHWFDLGAYYAEVRRVARPGAAIALVTYGIMTIAEAIDPVIRRFHSDVLGPYWPPERRHVEDGYRSLPFPFNEIHAPELQIRMDWTLADLVGYVETWSAMRALERVEDRAPVEGFRRDIARVWGSGRTIRSVRWPLSLRVGRL